MTDDQAKGVAELATRLGLRQGYLAGYEQAMHDMCMLGMLGYERPRECWNWLRDFVAGELDQWGKSIDPGEVPRFTFPASWHRQRSAALARDGACVDCGRADSLECDHIKAVSDGGYGILTNLCARCSTCHRAKTAARRNSSAP